MNKEEKKVINILKRTIKNSNFCDNIGTGQIEILLNYIDKLQKENDNLNKKNKRYEKYLKNKDIEHEKVLEYIETEKERDYISKDKIRKLIKELEEYITGKRSSCRHLSIDEALIGLHILKELLGE